MTLPEQTECFIRKQNTMKHSIQHSMCCLYAVEFCSLEILQGVPLLWSVSIFLKHKIINNFKQFRVWELSHSTLILWQNNNIKIKLYHFTIASIVDYPKACLKRKRNKNNEENQEKF
jgi:hypothetical protein